LEKKRNGKRINPTAINSPKGTTHKRLGESRRNQRERQNKYTAGDTCREQKKGLENKRKKKRETTLSKLGRQGDLNWDLS